MDKKIIFFNILLVSLFIFGAVAYSDEEMPVIKFFPLDQSVSFSGSQTKLQLISETDQDEYEINWTAFSTVDRPVYLRQDVSLLYVDGRLKGILNKWQEKAQTIEQKSSINGEDSTHFQALTFHHGEVHYPDDIIKSIQSLTYDELYVIDSPHSALESFKQPANQTQRDWKRTLDHATNQQLSYSWRNLIEHFAIKKEDYLIVPLTGLPQYQHKNLPALNKEQTDQVIGQLWEGLYRHYVMGFTDRNTPNKQPINTFVPLILFDKQGTHLIVLYQDQYGEKQQLLQTYPFSDNR